MCFSSDDLFGRLCDNMTVLHHDYISLVCYYVKQILLLDVIFAKMEQMQTGMKAKDNYLRKLCYIFRRTSDDVVLYVFWLHIH